MTRKDGRRTLIALSSLFAITSCLIYMSCSNPKDLIDIKEFKDQKEITRDAEALGVDMSITETLNINEFTSNYERLKFVPNEPVLIEYDDSFDPKIIEAINASVDFYNFMFSMIDKTYSFQAVSASDKTVIKNDRTKIVVKNIKPDGVAHGSLIPEKFVVGTNGVFVKEALMKLNQEVLRELSLYNNIYTITHEVGHALGFGDSYVTLDRHETNYIMGNTFMTTDNAEKCCIPYPNDFGILNVLYFNDFDKFETYDEAIASIKMNMDGYENLFYTHYLDKMEERTNKFDDIDRSKVDGHTYSWERVDVNGNQFINEVSIKGDTYEYIIYDGNKKVLEKNSGKTIYTNGKVILEGISLKDIDHYSTEIERLTGCDMFFVMYEYDGKVSITDNVFNYGSIGLKKVEKGPTKDA